MNSAENFARKVADRLSGIEERLKSKYGLRRFSMDEDLLLIPLSLKDRLPKGLELTSIMGKKYRVGVDTIDEDTRGGLLAYGVTEEQYRGLFEALESLR